MTDPTDICIWPDCTWCHGKDIEEYQWKSDDFRIRTISGTLSDDSIEDLVTQGLL